MSIKLPTLSTSGTLYNPVKIIERLYRYFEVSSRKQSLLYKDHISSYRYLEHLYADDMDRLTEAVTSTLETLFNRYFDDVEINTEYTVVSDALYKITIEGTFKTKENTYQLNKNIDVGKALE